MKDRKKVKPKRPIFHMGRLTVRAIRGPDEQGRYYWRTFRYENKQEIKRTIPGWHLQKDAEDLAADMRAGADAPCREDIRIVTDLLEFWLGAQLERADTDLAAGSKRIWKLACRHLNDTIGEVMLTALDVTTVDRHQNTRRANGAAVTTVRNELNVLNMAWKWGQQLGACPFRALPRTKPLKDQPVYCDYVPTALEFAKVLHQLEVLLAPTPRRPMRAWPVMFLRLQFAMGPRPGEVASLTWSDVTVNARANTALVVLGVHEGARKTGRREFPLDGEVVTHLREWKLRCTGERLFPVSRQTALDSIGSRHLHEACARAGVQRFTLKGLRALLANYFARNQDKVDVGTGASLLGHSPTTMWKYYRKVSDEDKRRVSKVLRLGQVATVGQLLELLPGGDDEPE